MLKMWLASVIVSLLLVAPARAQNPVSHLTATANAGTITVTWDANTDGVTTGYQVLYGTTNGGPYPTVLDAGNMTSLVVTGLMPGVPYYFVAQAYNAAKVLSPFSNQPTVTLGLPCTYILPGTTTVDTRPAGYAIQGFNPMAGQAQRIGDLRSWGWRVEWQFDSPTQKLFLMAWCVGKL